MKTWKKTLAKVTVGVVTIGIAFGGGMHYYSEQAKAKTIEENHRKAELLKAQQIKVSKVITEKLRDEFRMGGPVNDFKYTFNSVDAFHKSLLENEKDGIVKKTIKEVAKKLIGKEYIADLKATYTMDYVFSDKEDFVKVDGKNITIYLDQPKFKFETDFDKSRFDTEVGLVLQSIQRVVPFVNFTYTDEDRRLLYIKAVETGKERLMKENKEVVEKMEEDTISKIENFISAIVESEGYKVNVEKRYDQLKI
ncbi:hypothetical protein [Bacillus thuringiensis]|uniref:hypothetical protein n=1 Tax=Bacillus thuringiensis TaxID=1428 RepID=UPI0021D6512C|nr:hypothetical protein [Bacillus thuringiensis]MCU7667372.1 hypothetical protein [Bacillus thuringiensis]